MSITHNVWKRTRRPSRPIAGSKAKMGAGPARQPCVWEGVVGVCRPQKRPTGAALRAPGEVRPAPWKSGG